ncbi:hypothetical protein JD844_009952, partial [Phrynosoma platyrhinos]
ALPVGNSALSGPSPSLSFAAMVPVLPGLFLGSSSSSPSPSEATLALLVVDSEPPAEAEEAVAASVFHVEVLDRPEADLLGRLDAALDFIRSAREGLGRDVLVRCQAGISRSVAVVTAYLMKTNNLPFEEAYAFIQAIKPDAKMNEGFEWQLKLYEKMGCKVNVTSAVYKQYRLQRIAERYPVILLSFYLKNRRRLFRSSSILSHDEGKGPAAFAHKRFSEPAPFHCNRRSSCTSYFIEPLQWMEPVLLGVMEGQLLCPKCTSKLGSFHWHGVQCSCGQWVTPAFQIHKSRVDEAKGLPVGGLLNVTN